LNLDYILFKGQTLNWNTLAKKISEDPEDDFGSEAAGFNTAGFPGSLYSLVSGISLENELWNSHIINLIGVKGYYYNLKHPRQAPVHYSRLPFSKQNTTVSVITKTFN
jgi:hypothetical protein